MLSFEPSFKEISDFEESVKTVLKKYFPDKLKFSIEAVDKNVRKISRCCGIVLPSDSLLLFSLVTDKIPSSVLVRECGTIESVSGQSDPDCYLVGAAAKFVLQFMPAFKTNFRGNLCNGKIRQFIKILEKLNQGNNLENVLDIANTFE